jgi:hypothetical protein
MVHYHIRWSDSHLDWQTFSAPEEAQHEAERLARPGETYTIDVFDDNCEKCGAGLVASTIKTTRKLESP